MEVEMQEDLMRPVALLDREFPSVASMIVQLSELSSRLDWLEEHWNDPQAVRSRLGQLAVAQSSEPS
jgi:hypothetical protein